MRDEMKESQHSLTRADYEAPVCQRLCQAEHVPLEEVSLADWRPKISECHSNVVEANLGATAVRNSGGWPGLPVNSDPGAPSLFLRSLEGQGGDFDFDWIAVTPSQNPHPTAKNAARMGHPDKRAPQKQKPPAFAD